MESKYDTTQLTEFPRYEPEPSQSGVSLFFNKFLKLPMFGQSDNSESSSKQPSENEPASQSDKQENEIKPASEALYYNEGRSLNSVLRRISSLVALNSKNGTRYEDTELARYWMPDDISKECYECEAKFSTLRRRHHCRVCGQIFCSRCCSQKVPGQLCGCAGGLRVCTYCCKVVLSYLKENDMNGEIGPDLKTLQENLQEKFPESSIDANQNQDGFMLSEDHPAMQDFREPIKEDVTLLYRNILVSLPTQMHRFRLIRYNNVWRGCDLIQWISDNTNHATRTQATLLCQRLLNEGYIDCVTEQTTFVDYALYRPVPLLETLTDDSVNENSEARIGSSISSYHLDLNLSEASARLVKTPKNKRSSFIEDDDDSCSVNADYQQVVEGNEAIAESGREHLTLLMRQCLSRESLALTWLDILMPLCKKAAESILPELSYDIDVRSYVQIKKVSHGLANDSHVVQGVVLSKNVCHRSMPHCIISPKILLLDCSISYQRVEGKLTSLEPVLMQEHEYLVRCAARIMDLRPNVVLVRGSAARKVQDILMNEGVALVVGVRLKTLRRVARCTKADIVSSIDARIGIPKLGTCKSFNIGNYNGKTLMSFECCAEPHLGCCVLLKGNTTHELVRVKKVTRFMLLAFYNWRFEYAFLTDIGALLSDATMTFDDEKSELNNEKLPKKLSIEHCDTNCDTNDTFQRNLDEQEIKKTVVKSPLNSAKSQKLDSDKNFSCGVVIKDNSDPLRARRFSVEIDDVFLTRSESVLKSQEELHRWTMDDAVLSISPNICLNVPYLETESGRKCHLRQYFHTPLFQRDSLTLTPKSMRRKLSKANEQCYIVFKPSHPFVKNAITVPADDPKFKASLAHFRATGCRLPPKHFPGCPSSKARPHKQVSMDETQEKEINSNPDPLAPENHQRLGLLIYSFSKKSDNYPDFCINPWIAKMEMYSKYDITLGTFLNKYCFNDDYKCPSTTCHTLMFHHIRRFVHGDSCITLTCNTVHSSTNSGRSDEQSNQVMWSSRCSLCHSDGQARALGGFSRRLSLAKYLEWRYRAQSYVAHCGHPLADHAHYFTRGSTSACFKLSKIKCWDISLPAETISTFYDTRVMRDELIARVNDLMLMGHDFFTSLSDPESEKEYSVFKQHMEQINMSLTSSALQEPNSLAGVVHCLWKVSDRVIFGEKMLRDANDKWSSPPSNDKKPAKNVIDSNSDEKSDFEDSTTSENGNNESSNIPPAQTEIAQRTSECEHQLEDDEEKGDRKTVRAIISQLLSKNEKANENGLIIPGGLLPIIVYYGEISSVIAATLASVQYQQQLQVLKNNQFQNIAAESEDSDPNSPTIKLNSDGKSKSAKTSPEHIEVLLKDGLTCRVYYAAQFQNLRSLLISPLNNITDDFAGQKSVNDDSNTPKSRESTPKNDINTKPLTEIEEGFIRSLSRCIAWCAKGGKSGSTFCKTSDERYILKEMSKTEFQQFLEFAPHYFKYVINCHQSKLPSLLARIVGVYSVGGAGNGVLVMENLFYGVSSLMRFDLKGNTRNRLTTQPNVPDAVLMDENLLQLRWERQLYVSSHVGAVLWSALERDTSFLASHLVMDYSLLLGLDDDKGELVVGIIDYIRTYTLDKKLEYVMKKNLGSGTPTIVPPTEYKMRFCNSMKKYFLHCPAEWDGLHRGLIG